MSRCARLHVTATPHGLSLRSGSDVPGERGPVAVLGPEGFYAGEDVALVPRGDLLGLCVLAEGVATGAALERVRQLLAVLQ